jgi:Bacterial Ig-like domain
VYEHENVYFSKLKMITFLSRLATGAVEGVGAFATSGTVTEIELGAEGVRPNNASPGNASDGFENYPVLASAGSDATGTTISGSLSSLTNTYFRIEFYSSSISPSIFRGGEQFLGFVNVLTDAAGNASFTFHSPIVVPLGQYVLTTATQLVEGPDGEANAISTSEFSDGVQVGAVTPPPPVDTVGPTISNLLAPSLKTKGTPVVLTFSEALDVASAVNLANYLLVTAGRDKRFGTKDDKRVALRSATYNPTTHTVTLVPRKKLSVGVKYRLTVNGTSASGIEDLAGNLLDGNGDGGVSSNYVTIFKLTRPKSRR